MRPGKVAYSSGWKSRSGKVGQPPDRESRAGGSNPNVLSIVTTRHVSGFAGSSRPTVLNGLYYDSGLANPIGEVNTQSRGGAGLESCITFDVFKRIQVYAGMKNGRLDPLRAYDGLVMRRYLRQ